MTKTTIHSVPGLPAEVYTVVERRTGVTRFFPKIRGQHMLRLNGEIAWTDTLQEAQDGLREFVGRMQ